MGFNFNSWIRISIPTNPTTYPDPATQINTDPYRSGSVILTSLKDVGCSYRQRSTETDLKYNTVSVVRTYNTVDLNGTTRMTYSSVPATLDCSWSTYLDNLCDVFGDDADVALDDLDGIGEDVTDQLLDLLLEGGGEEHTLPVGPHVVTQGSNLRTAMLGSKLKASDQWKEEKKSFTFLKTNVPDPDP
jgi:hypothetical protein